MKQIVSERAAKPLLRQGKVSKQGARPKRGSEQISNVSLQSMTSGETLSLVERIRAGLPFASLEEFQQTMAYSAREVGDLLNIPPRTFIRRKEQGRLTADESDRLVRFSRLFGAAKELFEGDEAAARRWLQSPKKALGNVTPLEMARTEVGAREVEHFIGRLEHGAFS